jgi:hypothetical protein
MTDIHDAVAEIKAAGGPKPRAGRDPVNQPMVNSWVEAIGDTNPSTGMRMPPAPSATPELSLRRP